MQKARPRPVILDTANQILAQNLACGTATMRITAARIDYDGNF